MLAMASGVLTACHTAKPLVKPDTVAMTAPKGVKPNRQQHTGVATQVNYAAGRRFDALFLEAIRQKEAEHIDAEYELLDAALKIRPDAPEAL